MASRQYTIRGVGDELDARLREEARLQGTTLNAVVLATLSDATLVPPETSHTDLDWFIATADARCDEEREALVWLDALPAHLP
jgi:hypothetical protein